MNINSNSSHIGGPQLPIPNNEQQPTVAKTRTGSTAKERDQIDQSQGQLDQAAADLEQSLNFFLKGSNEPSPKFPVPGATVAASWGSGGGGGGFLGVNPMVRIQTAMLKLYELMRQSNLAQAQYENTAMSLNIAFAKTAASLIIAAGNSEAHMALLEAVAAGVGAAAAGLSAGFSVGVFRHAYVSGGQSLDAAKANVSKIEAEIGTPSSKTTTPETPATGKTKDVEAAQARYNASHEKLADLKADKARIEAEHQNASTKELTPENKAKLKREQEQKLADTNRQIEAKQAEVSHNKVLLEKENTEMTILTDKLRVAQGKETQLMQSQYQNFNNITQISGMLNTFFSQGAQAATKGMSVQDILDKAQAQAAQQIVDALRENIKMSQQTVSQSQQQMKDAMNSLMNDLKQISEMSHHVSLQRGG